MSRGNKITVALTFNIEAAKEVLARHSRIEDAAAEFGITKHALSRRFRTRGLYASSFLARVALPERMEIRAVHTERDHNGAVVGQTIMAQRESKDPPAYRPIPESHYIKGMSTYVGPEGNVRGQWIKTDHEREERDKEFWKACRDACKQYRGIAKLLKAPRKIDRNLHVIVPFGDPHVGMLSWAPETGAHFDTRIAERELYAVTDDLLDRTPPAESCTLLNLGDYFHAEDDKQLTPTSGHKLDADTRSAKIIQVGFNLFRRIIDRALLRFHKVRVVCVPGNHDPKLARMMMIWLQAVYEREPRVEVIPNFNPFHYWTFGKNLFGTCHGNELKLRDLPGIMAADRPILWGKTTHRFIHTGHVHNDQATEVQGTMVYTWRTLAPNDYWSHSHGYRAGKSLCALAYVREGGEYSRTMVDLGHVQRKIYAQ